MYAVIATGGKQYRVIEGETLKIQELPVEVGSNYDFDQVMIVGEGDKIQVGAPFLKSAKVTAEIVSHGRHDKIKIIKFRRRKHHMKHQGHRQNYTEIKITGIKEA